MPLVAGDSGEILVAFVASVQDFRLLVHGLTMTLQVVIVLQIFIANVAGVHPSRNEGHGLSRKWGMRLRSLGSRESAPSMMVNNITRGDRKWDDRSLPIASPQGRNHLSYLSLIPRDLWTWVLRLRWLVHHLAHLRKLRKLPPNTRSSVLLSLTVRGKK